jgi:hypothetical protein
MASVVAMATSKLGPALVDLGDDVLETGMVGSGIESGLGIVGEDEDPDLLAGTIGQRRGAADHLVARLASTPRRKESSTVSSNLALGNLARISTASLSG